MKSHICKTNADKPGYTPTYINENDFKNTMWLDFL